MALTGSGGAVWCLEPALSVQPPFVQGSTAPSPLLSTKSTNSEPPVVTSVLLSNSSFNGNTAALRGGACSLTVTGRTTDGSNNGNPISLLSFSSCNFTSNAALTQAGGGLHISTQQLEHDPAPESTFQLMASELVLLGNRAATGGGGLHVSGPFAVELSGTEVQGNVAVNGSGGGVAARDCLALSITSSNLSSNSALAGTGGGAVASGCGRVLLREVAVEGNRALAGGGLHLVSTGPTGGSAWTGGLPTRSSQPPTAAVLVQLRIFGNAAAQELGGGSGPLGGEQGRGGGLYVSGAVGVALNGADFSGGNTARLGSSIATTQTCLARRGVQSSPGAAMLSPPPRGPAPAAHEQLRVSNYRVMRSRHHREILREEGRRHDVLLM